MYNESMICGFTFWNDQNYELFHDILILEIYLGIYMQTVSFVDIFLYKNLPCLPHRCVSLIQNKDSKKRFIPFKRAADINNAHDGILHLQYSEKWSQ